MLIKSENKESDNVENQLSIKLSHGYLHYYHRLKVLKLSVYKGWCELSSECAIDDKQLPNLQMQNIEIRNRNKKLQYIASIFKSEHLKPSSQSGIRSQLVSKTVPYVFFNTIPNEKIMTLSGNVYFVFESSLLVNRKFGVSQTHTEGLKENYKYKLNDQYKIDKLLEKVYEKSLQQTANVNQKYQNATYLFFQEVYVKGKVSFDLLRYIVVNRRIGNDQITKLKKTLEDYSDVQLIISDVDI